MSTPCTPCLTASPNLLKLDPLKRVNYTFGLVLGVEEFLQSDTYFLAKHYLENRLLHGYGTVCGLDVVEQTAPQLEVQITPGWAISPRGEEIRVSQLMCLQVNDWVQTNLAALKAVFPGPAPSSLNLCIVLCYRECKTDVVPIPGEPCRTQSSSMAPSRIADSFELMLCLDYDASPPSPPASPPDAGGLCMFRPPQLEDDSIRALATLLSEVQISASGPFLTLGQMEQLVLDLIQPAGSPPAGPPYLVRAQDAQDFRRAALRTWITQVRPFICAPQGSGPCCPPPDKCVLLAELLVSLNPGWTATGVSIDDSRRPFLVPTRLLQETFFSEAAATSGSAYQTVAAGYFNMLGAADGPTYNLMATPASPPTLGEFLLNFSGYHNPASAPGLNYIVKGTVQDLNVAAPLRATFEFVDFEASGIRVRIMDTNSKALSTTLGYGFMVEISQIGGGL
jgi:hypothetical protein